MISIEYHKFYKSIHTIASIYEITLIPTDVCNIIVKYMIYSDHAIDSMENEMLTLLMNLDEDRWLITQCWRIAAENGYLEIVKYLCQTECPIIARYNQIIDSNSTYKNSHLNISKHHFVKKNNYKSVISASNNGHL